MNRLEVITEHERWNNIVQSFSNWDVYYLYEYADAMRIHGDGDIVLFYYEGAGCRMCYSVHRQDIGMLEAFQKTVGNGRYYDLTTPYGYGGPLTEGYMQKQEQESFYQAFREYCLENYIVTQFIRYHPVLQNHTCLDAVSETRRLKETIVIDITDQETIWNHIHPKNRNMIRKAEKEGVTVFFDHGEHMNDFIHMYESAMQHVHAEKYYYFKRDYYEYLLHNMSENIIFFYAQYQEHIVSAAMFLYNENYMHYHLSGSLSEYKKYAPTNLLLYKAAVWGSERNMQTLHLGGGIEDGDSLFSFKKQFNREGHLDFWIGRTIMNCQVYHELLELRKKVEPTFDPDNNHYIQYRKP